MSRVNADDKLIDKFFYVFETGGGGDCLFHVISFQLYGKNTKQDALKIRKEIVEYKDEKFIDIEDVDMYREGYWGTDIEVAKASNLYNRPILVYKKNRREGMAYEIACPGANLELLNLVRQGIIFPQIQKYFEYPYDETLSAILCIYFPDDLTSMLEPILIYNIDLYHYRALIPKDILEIEGFKEERYSPIEKKNVKYKPQQEFQYKPQNIESICRAWKQNPTINPRTGRTIQVGKKVYNDLMEECKKYIGELPKKISPPKKMSPIKKMFSPKKISTICNKWRMNPTVNPRTGRQIKINGPTFNELLRECGSL